MSSCEEEETHTILVGDIGGTNSRLRLYKVKSTDKLPVQEHFLKVPGEEILSCEYKNADYDSFVAVAEEFLSHSSCSIHPTTACLAVAGPVDANEVSFTNRSSWTINGYSLEQQLGIRACELINDFVAAGFGLLTLNEHDPEEVCVLQDVPYKDGAPIACVGAGTGLEGGHCEFPPRNDLEVDLLNFLKKKYQDEQTGHRISVERVVSGKGLANIYDFLRQRCPDKVNKKLDKKIMAAGDMIGRAIADGADNGDELCEQTMQIMTSAYGAEAGVCALKFLPFGGLYICGGLAPKNLKRMKSEVFSDAFFDKGRVSDVLKQVPVKVVLAENVGTRGAQLVAFRAFQKHMEEEQPPVPIVVAAPTTHLEYLPWVVSLGSLALAFAVVMKKL